MNNRCSFISHRGESYDAPENTLASINLAWERDADGVEIDIQISKDNEIVVIHDTNTKRIAGRNMSVKDQTLHELRQLDAGSWKDKKYSNERIPTLSEVLITVPANKKLIIEIKCGSEIVDPLIKAVNNSAIPAYQLEFICFDLKICSALKQAFPAYKVFLLSELDYTWLHRIFRPSLDSLIDTALKNNLDGLDVWAGNMIDEEFVAKCRKNNLLVYTWTVNSPEKALYLLKIGVDGITTDRAKWLKEKINYNT